MKILIFTKNTSIIMLITLSLTIYACKDKPSKEETSTSKVATPQPFFKLSLAQWSVHKMIEEEKLNPMDFAKKAKEWGFEGLEYVNQLYSKEIQKRGNNNDAILSLAKDLKKISIQQGMENQIMMVDLTGDENLLATNNQEHRKKAVENHKIWVDATATLGCHSMRINLFGSNNKDIWRENAVVSLTELSDYAATKNINIIVENHGYLSSNAALMAEVIKAVNKPNCGTLPDFGNFCLKREDNKLWEAPCIEEYDIYQGVKELMPFAKGVSAKSYNFDTNGNETKINFYKMMKIVKDANFNGFIGVEYEGNELNEEEGVLATKTLLLNVAKTLNN